jgi:hypothetical protein
MQERRPFNPPPASTRKRYPATKCMSSEEIDSILRIQYMATHPPDSTPYVHDYYASAASVKAAANKELAVAECKFWPTQLREVLPQERTGIPQPMS